MLGGRAAEKIVFNVISTGASDDIMRATELAKRMVTEFGMSEKLGNVRYAGQQLQYLGGAALDGGDASPRTRELIDAEVQLIIATQYERAQALLKERRSALETLAQQLLKQETVDGTAVTQALGDREARQGAPATSALEN
jgi:cell division protease FtsH